MSHDQHSSTYVYKHTVVLDLVPVCKDDLVFLPAKLANVIGGISPLCIVHRVSTYIYVVDPTTLQVGGVPPPPVGVELAGLRCGFTKLCCCGSTVLANQTAEISGEKYWKYPFTPVLVRTPGVFTSLSCCALVLVAPACCRSVTCVRNGNGASLGANRPRRGWLSSRCWT